MMCPLCSRMYLWMKLRHWSAGLLNCFMIPDSLSFSRLLAPALLAGRPNSLFAFVPTDFGRKRERLLAVYVLLRVFVSTFVHRVRSEHENMHACLQENFEPAILEIRCDRRRFASTSETFFFFFFLATLLLSNDPCNR